MLNHIDSKAQRRTKRKSLVAAPPRKRPSVAMSASRRRSRRHAADANSGVDVRPAANVRRWPLRIGVAVLAVAAFGSAYAVTKLAAKKPAAESPAVVPSPSLLGNGLDPRRRVHDGQPNQRRWPTRSRRTACAWTASGWTRRKSPTPSSASSSRRPDTSRPPRRSRTGRR